MKLISPKKVQKFIDLDPSVLLYVAGIEQVYDLPAIRNGYFSVKSMPRMVNRWLNFKGFRVL